MLPRCTFMALALSLSACPSTTSVHEDTLATCTDGADNDGDGSTDCADPDCSGFAACARPDAGPAPEPDAGPDTDAGSTDDAGNASPDASTDGDAALPVDAGPLVETKCADLIDDDLDGRTDCDDPTCAVLSSECPGTVPPDCTRQRDCGDITKSAATNVCLEGKCIPPGPKTAQNTAVTAEIFFDLMFKTPLTGSTKPKTAMLRFIHPEKTDGTLLTCAEVIGKAADNTRNCVDQSTRSVLDSNASLNQVFRSFYTLVWDCSTPTCQFFNMTATVPKGQKFILYGEAWYGPRDSTNNPTGGCAALFCAEGQSVTADGQHFGLTFPDPNHPG
ncbi:MAG: hypothetical protein QM765_46120 [Myxococcales bacterium]